ncbi:MAG: MerR family transcriptional regulator [Coprobacillaceae bacterium]
MATKINKSEYLSIGQFAKASGVSRKNLIYYDSIGLFSPKVVLDNGYRYYYYRQLYTLNMICTLKEIGMPLKEIKNFTNNRGPQQMITLFEKQKDIIENEINKLMQVRDMMNMQIETTKLAEKITLGEIGIEYHEAEALFKEKQLSRKKGESITLSKMLSTFSKYAKANGYHCAFPWGIQVDIGKIKKNDLLNATQFYYRVKNSEIYKPAGRYVVTYCHGIFQERERVYKKIYNYAKENGYHLKNDLYEDCLLNEISTSIPEKYIVRVSVPIKD